MRYAWARGLGSARGPRAAFGRRPKTFHVADLDVVEITNSEFTRPRQPFGQRPERCTPAACAPQNCAYVCVSALSVSSVLQT